MKEQVAIAALDCNANRFAFQLVEAIRNEFPSSKRADRLTGGADCAARQWLCLASALQFSSCSDAILR